jgi:opacity protein-like surface antigen
MQMRKFLLLISVMCLLPLAAQAQETPKVEVFGGYSYLRSYAGGESAGANGWNASVTVKAKKWLGLVSDFSGYYNSYDVRDAGVNLRISGHVHSFLFGPRVSVRAGKATPFAHALFGGAHDSARWSGGAFRDNAFGMALGGGLDLKVTDRVAVRVVQADYYMTRIADATQNSLRVSTGLVFRLGSR